MTSQTAQCRPRVLVISLVKDRIGGGEITMIRFAKNNAYANLQFLVPEGELAKALQAADLNVETSTLIGPLLRDIHKNWPLSAIRQSWYLLKRLRNVYARNAVDIVHVYVSRHAAFLALSKFVLRVPLVAHVHRILDSASIEGKLHRLMACYIDKYIAVSSTVEESLVECGVPKSKIVTIPNGIDINREFNPVHYLEQKSLRFEYGLSTNTVTVGMLGVITFLKGFHVYIEAIAMLGEDLLRGAHFFIIGDVWPGRVHREYYDCLRQKVLQYGLENRILFTGWRDNVAAVLSDLDIVVHASVEPDAFPTTVLEAMAMERCVIAVNAWGVKEMINDGWNGLLFAPGDARGLRDRLRWAIQHPEERRVLGLRARRTVVERFNVEDWQRRVGDLYCEVIKRSRRD